MRSSSKELTDRISHGDQRTFVGGIRPAHAAGEYGHEEAFD
jgi:hypothetical protein